MEEERKAMEETKIQAAQDNRPLKKIAIVGCSDTKVLAPYDDLSWDIWAMNNSFAHTRRQTKWFEIHPIKEKDGTYFRRELIRPGVFKWSKDFRGQTVHQYMESLAALDIPVYMQQHWDIIPKSIRYPLEEVLAKFGNYFTNSVSYMIVMAIKEILEGGFKGEIGCWGVDMATTTEYGPQRPSCEFFLGCAAGLQIAITIPPQADLLKTKFLYGFQEREAQAWEEKMISMAQNLENRKQQAAAKAQALQAQVQQYIGAQEAIKEVQKIWSNMGDSAIWRGADGKVSS
jgi:hypothetical protein